MKTNKSVRSKVNRSAKLKAERSGTSESLAPKIPLGPILQRYFCEYLVSQRDLSQNTITS